MLRTRATRTLAVTAALSLALVGWYLGSPLFIRTTLNEALPSSAAIASATPAGASTSATTTAAPTAGTTTTIQARGQLQYVDALHNGKGAVLGLVVASCCPVGDRYLVRFEEVAITNAPDVHVYLSTERGGAWSPATSKYLGPLKATNGSFSYDITPSDLGTYRSVVVWCRAFSVLITWADLERV